MINYQISQKTDEKAEKAKAAAIKHMATVRKTRACYGMEWKENFNMEYKIVKVWNGRFH